MGNGLIKLESKISSPEDEGVVSLLEVEDILEGEVTEVVSRLLVLGVHE